MCSMDAPMTLAWIVPTIRQTTANHRPAEIALHGNPIGQSLRDYGSMRKYTESQVLGTG
jgi:hypothetical protein